MSEREIKISIYIRPVNPPFDGVKRFAACLDTEAHPVNFTPLSCRLAIPLSKGNWYSIWTPITVGTHYVSIGVILAEIEAYLVEVFIRAFDGVRAIESQFVDLMTLRLGEPQSFYFRINPEYPWIEKPDLIPRRQYELTREEVIEIYVNNPDTKSLLEMLQEAGENLWSAITGVGGSLSGLLGIGHSLINRSRDTFFGSMSELFQRSAEESIQTSLKAIDDVTSESPEWKQEIDQKLTNYTQGLVGDVMKTLSPEALGESPLTPEQASTALTVAGLGGIGLHTTAFIGGIVAEAVTLGQLDGLTRISAEVMDKLGLGELARAMVMTPLEPLMLIPARQHWFSQFTPLIPPYTDLINMVVKEKIDLDVFKFNMKYTGYSEEWSQLIWDAHFIAPNFGDIRRAYYRSEWTEETKLAMMKRVDLDPFYNDTVWNTLMYEIPPVSELVNQRVKEVIGDIDFAKGLKFHGYTPEWALRIWDAHYMPPTLGDIMTAFRRGIPVTIPTIDPETGTPITRDVPFLEVSDVHELMKLVDLDPRYNSLFDTRFYRDPSIRESRYMYETGAIDESGVKNLVVRSGLDPLYVDEMTHYLTHFTERTYQRRYLTALSTAFANDTYTETQVTELVGKAGFTEGVANWIIEIGKVRRDIRATPRERLKPRILTMSQLDRAYIKDVIDESEYTTRMLQLNYETLDIALKVQILNLDKHVEEEGRRVIRLTTAQLINAWKEEVITEDEIRIELQLRGLDTTNVERLIETNKRKWGLSEIEEA